MIWENIPPDRQEKLKNDFRKLDTQKCLHENCPQCHGSGVQFNNTPCIHMISCPCPKCTPLFR